MVSGAIFYAFDTKMAENSTKSDDFNIKGSNMAGKDTYDRK